MRKFIFYFILPFLLLSFGACKKIIYVPLESKNLQSDSVRQTSVLFIHDTVRFECRDKELWRDSIVSIVDSTGRALSVDRWHFRDRERKTGEINQRSLILRDTVFIARHDTILSEIPVRVSEKSNVASGRGNIKIFLILTIVLVLLLINLFRKK